METKFSDMVTKTCKMIDKKLLEAEREKERLWILSMIETGNGIMKLLKLQDNG